MQVHYLSGMNMGNDGRWVGVEAGLKEQCFTGITRQDHTHCLSSPLFVRRFTRKYESLVVGIVQHLLMPSSPQEGFKFPLKLLTLVKETPQHTVLLP